MTHAGTDPGPDPGPVPGARPDPDAGISLGHLGICVADLQRSLRFYTEGLGFTPGAAFDVDDTFAATLEVDGPVRLRSQFVARDGLAIELLHFTSPASEGRPVRRRNRRGFTHLSFHVSNIAEAQARIVAAGGSVLEHTRTELGGGTAVFVFCTDPDGVRIELMQP